MIRQPKKSPQAQGALEATSKSVAGPRQSFSLQSEDTHLNRDELFLSILFVLRLNKRDKKKIAVIYCRITLKSKRAGDFSTGIRVNPREWLQKEQSIIGRPEDNLKLSWIKNRLTQIKSEFLILNKPVTAKIIKDFFLGKNIKKSDTTLLEVMDEEIYSLERIIGNGMAEKTWKTYHTRRNIIADFLWRTYHRKDIPLSDITPGFAKDLLFYLKGERKFAHNYAVKTIQGVKRVLQHAFNCEYIKRNPLAGVKMRLEKPKEIIHLEEHELEKLQHLQLESENLRKVLDVFIFCCYTGLAYIDVARLHPTHFKQDKSGTQLIIMRREKTTTTAYIPLFPQAIHILQKYESDPKCIATGKLLPVLTNQCMNKFLKQIAFIAGLKHVLVTHMARKTFAMLMLNNGIAIESVSTMLGHSRIQVTQAHYAKIKVDTIAKDFKELAARKGISTDEKLTIGDYGKL